MRWRTIVGVYYVLGVLLSGALCSCGGGPIQKAPFEQPLAPADGGGVGTKVVILVIDGLRYAESFGDPARTHIPRLAGELRPQGALFDDFRNEGLTSTNPGHTSMLTGTWQEVANDGSERPDRPTLFEYYRKYYSAPADRAWIIAGKAKLDVCSYGTHPSYGPAYGATENVGAWSDAVVVDSVLVVLERAHPVLLVVNLPSVDAEGHSGDWDRYVSAIEAADSLVLEVWSALQDDPFYAGSTYFFVTNDHGRHDDAHGGFQNHGCPCEGCEHVMLLVVGPEIVPGLTVAGTYDLRDICNTAGEILGCPAPESEGVTISEMFAGGLTGIPAGTP